ncbi:phage major capsid protein [Amycolatopsis tolypomycina]|uniref:phage major capsid protein n=1 Tax=Amycolatopsis tolypomycina TaxID=208445 RepID=UPI0033A0F6CB
MDIKEKQQERAGLAKKARTLLDLAEEGGRALSAEETQQFDRLMSQCDDIDAVIEREIKLREQERRIAASTAPGSDDGTGTSGGGNGGGPGDRGKEQTPAQRQMAAFRAYLLNGRQALVGEHERALNMGSDPEGGYLVAPQEWVAQLIKFVDDAVQLRGLATVRTLTTGESLGVPSLDTDLNDAEWTSEVATGSQDDSLRLGKREFRPNPLAKRVKISRKLLRAAAMDPEALVRDRMGYKFGVASEKAYMVGDGNKKPLGLFTASNDGISTARDVSFGAAGAIPLTSATGDQLVNIKYTLKAAYWTRARWLWHRDVLREIRKLKDNNGVYLWQPGLTGDRPDTILEVPYIVSEFAPNTVTSGGYVGMLGDFSFYWIVDALSLEIQRLIELYAETNQVGFIGRLETDGMPVLEEAFVRVKVA